ncbi:hypothetical protein E2C01_018981 [Portunus trituberculatus]|uniref:Uncharacterized protein n=1 Tax=Portunus trituberculatus TaxID=210409 RepID=A0A5B7DWQ8_PORTR|nr:hypothetical protein [Portunus trituberculatus]
MYSPNGSSRYEGRNGGRDSCGHLLQRRRSLHSKPTQPPIPSPLTQPHSPIPLNPHSKANSAPTPCSLNPHSSPLIPHFPPTKVRPSVSILDSGGQCRPSRPHE